MYIARSISSFARSFLGQLICHLYFNVYSLGCVCALTASRFLFSLFPLIYTDNFLITRDTSTSLLPILHTNRLGNFTLNASAIFIFAPRAIAMDRFVPLAPPSQVAGIQQLTYRLGLHSLAGF